MGTTKSLGPLGTQIGNNQITWPIGHTVPCPQWEQPNHLGSLGTQSLSGNWERAPMGLNGTEGRGFESLQVHTIGHAVPCRGIGSANGNNQITWPIGHAVPCRGIGSANGNNQITWPIGHAVPCRGIGSANGNNQITWPIGHTVPCRGIGSANGNNQITWAHWARSPLSGNWERQWEQPNYLGP
jgi:hypothetical protein